MISYKKSEVELFETGHFPDVLLDYINGSESLKPFYSYLPKLDSFKKAIEDKKGEHIERGLLADVLLKQYSALANTNLQKAAIELLRDKNTFTVCTGHQLCLFTGPLYFVYKIISTINLAEELKKNYPQYNFIPLYWMASEDHDFDEISSVNLFGKKITWQNPEARGRVGKISTSTMVDVLEEFKQIAGDSANAKELVQLFSDAYTTNNNLADATRYIVHALFAKHGLIILDGDDKQLKASFRGIMADDITSNTNYKLVSESISELEKIGIKAQVNPRTINCFYVVDNLRERIEFDGELYKVLNTEISFTAEELKQELESNPQNFSPNVVLRPLYQQKILPNLAYIGGPGELAYWLEYKKMFDFHKINFPVLIPRNFSLLLDAKSVQQLQKIGFTITDLFGDTEQLIKEFINRSAGEAVMLKNEEQALGQVYAEIATKAIAIDATLKATVEADLQKALNGLKALEAKMVRAEKQKQETSVNQIRKLKERFFPGDSLQERHDTLTTFYLKSGNELMDVLKATFEPFDYRMIVLEL